MNVLTLATQVLRTVRRRRAIRSMAELDDRILADVGLLRTDLHALLARPHFADPSRRLKDTCCLWRTFASRFQQGTEPLACC